MQHDPVKTVAPLCDLNDMVEIGDLAHAVRRQKQLLQRWADEFNVSVNKGLIRREEAKFLVGVSNDRKRISNRGKRGTTFTEQLEELNPPTVDPSRSSFSVSASTAMRFRAICTIIGTDPDDHADAVIAKYCALAISGMEV